MKTAYNLLKLRIETPWSIFLHRINKLIYGKNKANELKYRYCGKYFQKTYLKNGIWDFKGIKLPVYKNDIDFRAMYAVYLDTLFVYCKYNDNYENRLIDKLDYYLPEGTYSYISDEIDVTVKSGDVVIDAGAWIGDFSAYASRKGAGKVYAFEPGKSILKFLYQTKDLNPNITVIEKGLGNETGQFFLTNNLNDSSTNQIMKIGSENDKIEVTTVDEFVFQNKLDSVDFIKADIEGFERNMLLGAKETLKKFGPKLAICTYHLPDDPEVLSNIILNANPNYSIIQKRKKLYAMVKS